MIYPVAMGYLEPERELSDEEVLASSVHTPSLFAILVRKYEDAFLRKAMSIVRAKEEAEDVVQEAFTKMYLNANKFQKQEGAQFSSWAYRIVINTALTHYTKQKRHKGHTAELDDEIWALIPDKNLRQFEKKELEDLVASVLTRMPSGFAKALSGFLLEGKSQEEMAAEEGVSVGAIKTRVHRAKKEFKEVYETLQNKTGL